MGDRTPASRLMRSRKYFKHLKFNLLLFMSLRSLKFLVFAAIGTLVFASSRAATVETLKIPSAAMKKEFPALIVKPDSYAKGQEALPVVYVLHGHAGTYATANHHAPLSEFADRFNLIVVCPDGAGNSWYFDVPSDPNHQFETYVSSEVVSFIDKNYRTIAAPKGRAITGMSMGGHGAMYLALRHKDVFGAAGSTSGGLDIRPFPKSWQISDRIGTIEEHPEQWESHTAINNISNVQNGELALIIDCGLGDFFLKVNRSFHEALMKQKIDHDYIERPGIHEGPYWKNAIQYQMLFFHNFFVKAAIVAPAPAPQSQQVQK